MGVMPMEYWFQGYSFSFNSFAKYVQQQSCRGNPCKLQKWQNVPVCSLAIFFFYYDERIFEIEGRHFLFIIWESDLLTGYWHLRSFHSGWGCLGWNVGASFGQVVVVMQIFNTTRHPRHMEAAAIVMYMYLYSLAFMDHPCTLGAAVCHQAPPCPLYTQPRARRVWARRTNDLKIVSTLAGFEPTISRMKVECTNH